MNQQIDVSGQGNIIRVSGSGKLRIGNQEVSVSGEGNSVTIASGRTLRIGGLLPAPPEVCRGQIWQHNVLARRYQVISVRRGVARCLVLDVNDEPIQASGKAMIEDITAINMRVAYKLVGGAS